MGFAPKRPPRKAPAGANAIAPSTPARSKPSQMPRMRPSVLVIVMKIRCSLSMRFKLGAKRHAFKMDVRFRQGEAIVSSRPRRLEGDEADDVGEDGDDRDEHGMLLLKVNCRALSARLPSSLKRVYRRYQMT